MSENFYKELCEIKLPRTTKKRAVKAKLMLTEKDVKRLWRLFTDSLSEGQLDSDAHRGSFNENIILTADYDTNRKVVMDLARQICPGQGIDHKGPKVLRMEMPPPKTDDRSRLEVSLLSQESLQLARDQPSLDERLFEYIVERKGEISRTNASQDLGVTLREIDESIERLWKAGRLPRPSDERATQIEEQTRRCMYCQGEIFSGSRFCIHCGRSQEEQTMRASTEPQLSDDWKYDRLESPPMDQKKLGEATRSETGRSRFGLIRKKLTTARHPVPDLTRSREKPCVERRFFKSGDLRGNSKPQLWGQRSRASPLLRPVLKASHESLQPMSCRRCGHIMERHGKMRYCSRCRRYL